MKNLYRFLEKDPGGHLTTIFYRLINDQKAKELALHKVTILDNISQVTVYRHLDDNTCGIMQYLACYQKPTVK